MSFGEVFAYVVVGGIGLFLLAGFVAVGIAMLPLLLVVGGIAFAIWVLVNDTGRTVAGGVILALFCLVAGYLAVEGYRDHRDPSRRQGLCPACKDEVKVSLGTVDAHTRGGEACPGVGKPRLDSEGIAAWRAEQEAARVRQMSAARAKEKKAAAAALKTRSAEAAVAARGPTPRNRLIRSPHDAEVVAAEWMRWMGFADARATPVGTDGGIDVTSREAIAQVKMEGVPTGRPVIQNAFGVAQGERKKALVFSLGGYVAGAVTWADRVGVPLFRFDLQGVPEPVNGPAKKLFRGTSAG